MEAVTTLDLIMRSLLAVLCGGILGWEREQHNKPAGLRTQMMVALGAAAFTAAMFHIYDVAAATAEDPQVTRFDPLRIVEGIIGGIGFLGAGTIIRSRGSVQGVTTAATVWVVGAIGVACGIGAYEVALSTLTIAFMVLWGIGRLERWMIVTGHRGRSAKASPRSRSPEFPREDADDEADLL